MKKIVVDYQYKDAFHAGSKAREDVNRIAENNGFTSYMLNTYTVKEMSESHRSPIYLLYYRIRKLFVLSRAILQIKRRSIVLLQYPLEPFRGRPTLFFCRWLRKKKSHLVVLVHDITRFRYEEVFDKTETAIFNTASELIVHTAQMQELFKKNGVVSPCRRLWLFDYLTEEVPDNENHQNNSTNIAFAGNLDKSVFLKKLTEVHFYGVQLHLYGNKPQSNTKYPEWIKYGSRFSPDNVTALTEGWGLTWDGDSIEALQGPLGNYMKYNSPHKTSLYIAAGIPVVLSKEAALAEFVEENNLGITIHSLLELENRIVGMDKEELQLIRKHVAEMSAILRKGGKLGVILKDIVKDVEG
ncbi:MAG: hypothetical protein IJK22_00865 [Bacteroidales bacterium]|nr:hypothetical protein [Bacteroidales bacterium]